MKSFFALLWLEKLKQNRRGNTQRKGNNCSLSKQGVRTEKVGSFHKLSAQMALCVSLAHSPSSCRAGSSSSLPTTLHMDRPYRSMQTPQGNTLGFSCLVPYTCSGWSFPQVSCRLQQLCEAKTLVQRPFHFQGSCTNFADTCTADNLGRCLNMPVKIWSCCAQRLFIALTACSHTCSTRSLPVQFW